MKGKVIVVLLKAYVVPHPPIILPEVGRGEEKKIQDTIDAMDKMSSEIAKLKPETIIISSPHAPMFRDAFYVMHGDSTLGNLKRFGVFNVEESVDLDVEMAGEIIKSENASLFAYSELYDNELDHGTLIPIRFLHKYYGDFKVVIIGLSGLSDAEHFKVGRIIQGAIDRLERRAVFIASGDLSHVLKEDGPYGYEKEGPEFDESVMEILEDGNLDELFKIPKNITDKAAQCGLKSFQILAGVLDKTTFTSEKYSYEGPFGVGYGVVGFEVEKVDPYILLARNTIEEYIKNGKKISIPSNLPKEMLEKRAGTFVTLHKDGELRGCIGTIGPTKESIAEEIINNAISASTKDPRFPEVVVDELKNLEISVDVLKPAESIEDISELDIEKYGVIVSSGYRRGLLLPNIEGIDDVSSQVEIALKKAGIRPDESYELERFEVIRHE